MAKYTTTVDAWEFTEENRSEIIQILGGRFVKDCGDLIWFENERHRTSPWPARIAKGDYLVKESYGKFYVLSARDFKKDYKPKSN